MVKKEKKRFSDRIVLILLLIFIVSGFICLGIYSYYLEKKELKDTNQEEGSFLVIKEPLQKTTKYEALGKIKITLKEPLKENKEKIKEKKEKE